MRAIVLCLALAAGDAAAQARAADPAPVMAAQREAMAALSYLDGVWRGTAWKLAPGGAKHEVVQTERVGPFLDGTVKVVEGKAYESDGRVAFNAFGVLSYDAAKKAYSLRSYTMGQSGDYPVELRPDGFVWSIPQASIVYTVVIRDGTWHEVGDRVVPGQPPLRVLEMRLRRVGDSDWPLAGSVPPR